MNQLSLNLQTEQTTRESKKPRGVDIHDTRNALADIEVCNQKSPSEPIQIGATTESGENGMIKEKSTQIYGYDSTKEVIKAFRSQIKYDNFIKFLNYLEEKNDRTRNS